ncbi:hypothetical protein [Cellulomonas triticagri]|uniref:hypothetical protein n=1 Tax=Cellulomonas triticagri TaxID=2483352 RepID=UPI0011C3640D|nr:hypothetical protein [Cellulomonas triticagri]
MSTRILVVTAFAPVFLTTISGRGRSTCSLACFAMDRSGPTGGWMLLIYLTWLAGPAGAAYLAVRCRAAVEAGRLTVRTATRTRSVPLAEVESGTVITRRARWGTSTEVRLLVLGRGGGVHFHVTDRGGVWHGARASDLLVSAGIPVERDHREHTATEFDHLVLGGRGSD